MFFICNLLIFLYFNKLYILYGFYVIEVASKDFVVNEEIDIEAVKLTSVKAVIPYEYYTLPFCKPLEKLRYKLENFGQLMRGDCIVNTPYKVFMKKDINCSYLCYNKSSKIIIDKKNSAFLRQRIIEDYYVHLLIDNLPCVTKYIVPETKEVHYNYGYKLGWSDKENQKIFVNNHLEIVLKYHKQISNVFRIVGFEVYPKSINQVHYSKTDDKTCQIEKSDSLMLQEIKENINELIWSYSTRWELSEIPWTNRWDIYINNVKIQWFYILYTFIAIICLTGFSSLIIIRTVQKNIAKYNYNDEEISLEETGWKLVHGDVFRPPPYTMFLVNLIGTGIQLIGMTIGIIIFAIFGILAPFSRGSLTSLAIFLYFFMALIAGYHSGRLYKTLRGNKPKKCAFKTAIMFPLLILGTRFFLNFFLINKNSSATIPFTQILKLLILLIGLNLPLIFLGFYFGFRKQMYVHPVKTNQIPRQIPNQPWYLKMFSCIFLSGLLPFGFIFVELYLIFPALWENKFFFLFNF